MAHRQRVGRYFGVAGLTAALACTTTAVSAGAVAGAGPAAAGTVTTLQLYLVDQYNAMFRADGQPMSTSAQPVAGDYLIAWNEDYLGNHLHHSKTSTGADDAVCTFTSPTEAICDQVVAMGGSLILMNHVKVDFASKTPVVEITGGTGIFEGAHGSITVTPLPTTNTDIVIRYWT
ncbi:MAG: hypothetical protein ABSE77_23015 [Acidimicrobiales bacterium]|jgi:hypothetical protein